MSAICFNCGKGTVMGRTQRHHRGVAGKRWNKRAHMTARTFKPNLQKTSIMLAGQRVKMSLCAKCIKKFRGAGVLASQQHQSVEALLAAK
jgi:large subunit ribosomal protein L28